MKFQFKGLALKPNYRKLVFQFFLLKSYHFTVMSLLHYIEPQLFQYYMNNMLCVFIATILILVRNNRLFITDGFILSKVVWDIDNTIIETGKIQSHYYLAIVLAQKRT
jgi:hypothetical protein